MICKPPVSRKNLAMSEMRSYGGVMALDKMLGCGVTPLSETDWNLTGMDGFAVGG